MDHGFQRLRIMMVHLNRVQEFERLEERMNNALRQDCEVLIDYVRDNGGLHKKYVRDNYRLAKRLLSDCYCVTDKELNKVLYSCMEASMVDE